MRNLLFLLTLLAAIAFAEPAKIIGLADLPGVAQKTVQQNVGNAPISEVERRTEDGETVFDVTFAKGDEERELTVAEDGTLLSIEVTLAETPAKVRATIQQQLKDATIDQIDKTFDEGEVSYEVYITRGSLEQSFEVAADGKLLRLEITLQQAPQAVQKTIAAQGGKPGDIFRVFEDGEIFYDVEITRDGQERELSLGADGKLLSEEVTLAEVPKAVQKTVNNRVGKGQIQRIDKVFGQKQQVTYEVMAKKEGKRLEFTVGPHGRILKTNK